MSKDMELDRLGAERNKAFEELKAARNEKNRLGKACSRLHDELDEAYRAQHRTHEAQQTTWESHKQFMDECSRKIDFYKTESDRHHENMVYAFQQASNAHDSRDGAGAKSWSNSGHNYKAQMREAKEQISYWVSQSKDAKFRFENSGYKVDFERAKKETTRLKDEFAMVSSQYKEAKLLLEQKQAEFERAKRAFEDRLNFLKEQNAERKRRIGALAAKASYYERLARERGEQLFSENAQPWEKDRFQSINDFCKVKVRAGWSKKKECPTTECIIYVADIRDKHYHIVFDEYGNELISEWRNNH